MKLLNITKKKLITDNLEIANTFYKRSKGLLGYEKKNSPAMFFKTRWGIHTFGMKFPITVIICDKNMIIKKIKTNLKPNRLLFWNPAYEYVFELPFNQDIIHLKDKLTIKQL